MKTNWQTKKLYEVLKLEYGKPLPRSHRKDDGSYPVYGANGIKDFSDKFYFDKPSIIIGRKGSAGEINLTEKKFWPLDVTYFVTFDDKKYDLKFLYSLLDTLELTKLAKGVKPGVNRNDVYSIEVNIPPLPEQHRIVKILDEVFTDVAKAKENAGKNLQNAKELFESYLQSVFANPGKDWEEKKLGEVCIVERGSSPRPIDKYLTDDQDGVNWVKIGDTKGIDKYLYTTRQKVTKEGAKKSRFVKEDDFILTNSMSFGRPYIMKTTGYIHDGWFVLRLNKNIEINYFYYLLVSPYLQRQFKLLASGAIVKNISGDLVKKAIIPYPPFAEQKSIVKKLDALSAETKKLEAIYKKKLADLEELKKSVLKKAFSGEL